MKNIFKLIFILIIFNSCNTQKIFTDNRDGKKYKTVKIGKQRWMAENLNFVADSGCWCINDSINYCEKYGRLYNWKVALKVCPSGWHLPSEDEWNVLINYLGGVNIAGAKLKSTDGWNLPNTGASNSSGFNALPGGYRSALNNSYLSNGSYGNYWSSSEAKGKKLLNHSTNITLTFNNPNVSVSHGYRGSGYSVRCIIN